MRLVGNDGIVLRPQGQSPLALIPLDDEVLDFLIERNPRFVDECRKIRERMAQGAVHSQQEIDSLFGRSRQAAVENPSAQ
ncbi:MAG TPA: hypothetical protein VFI31_26460 [Pirellulales bacterium]|nr:hypothetical protein [Pirellulales bacterium]